MIDTQNKIHSFLFSKQCFLALIFGAMGALANCFPIELAFNISLIIGNTAFIVAASYLRPSLTLLCALVSVIPLYFILGHPFIFITFGLEAWFISTLRARGWYVLTADLVYWLLIGMPLTAMLIWINYESPQNYILFTTFKQAINAVLYTSLACILLYTFNAYFQSIKSDQPPLDKCLSKWLFYSFWSISAFFVISVSLMLGTAYAELQRTHFEKKLAMNSNYITHIGNSYLNEHQRAIQNVANQLSHISDPAERQLILARIHDLYPGFLTMLVASEQGQIELGSPQSLMKKLTNANVSISDRPYFIHAMQQQKLFVSSVFLGRGFGADPIVAISAPIYTDNQVNMPSGIVEGSLNLGEFGLYDTPGRDGIENEIKIIVTDQKNRIIYASDSLGFATLSQLTHDKSASQNTPNLIELTTAKHQSETFLYKQATLSNHWKIYSLVEHKVVLKTIEKIYLVIFTTLFVILLSVSFFAKKFASHLNRPLAFVMAQLSKARKTGAFQKIPFEAPTEVQELYQELKISSRALLHNQQQLQEQVFKRTEELNQANLKLTDQSIILEKSLKQAKAANIAKSDFLANMSHEIRTPMNGVLGALQVLKREDLTDSSKELIELGITSSKNLLSILNDILDLSKIESKNISLESLPSNVVELCRSIVSEFALLAKQNNIHLVFTVKEGMHAYWLVDPVRLRQVIINIISNAIKFTPKGEVNITLMEQNEKLIFAVKDTGIGISQAHLKNLFNRFEQADPTTTRKFGGTGLGLSIAKQLVNLMQGELNVTSQENVGSTFTVILPLQKTELKSHGKLALSKPQIPDAARLNILLAEDNKINQKVFNAIVSPTKATIRIANDGLEAIDEVAKQVPDLIFMDIKMPNMSGIQACEIIKERNPNIPIIALTANVMTQDLEKYKQTGFDHCIGKPIDVAEIYTLIQNMLKDQTS
jgi:signal transduction histidine kinase/ActR/RegA family two-component response regulator